jgi:[ribosomal protein S18]-alanine N-acetyltransferase
MDIRQMMVSDTGPVYRITCESLDQYFIPDVFSFFMMQWPAGQLVARDQLGKVVGYITGSRLGEGRVSIALFAVHPESRGLGVGSELLAAFRQRAAMEGARAIQLEVRSTNASAIRFYEKRGLRVSETLPEFYNDGGNGVRMIGPVRLNS